MAAHLMRTILLIVGWCLPLFVQASAEVRIKELTRVQGVRDFALVGYGLVVGLSNSGDSEKNRATRQALVNTLKHFNVNVADSDLNSRNTAAVMITANLSSYAEMGDKLDVEVSSLGDARSLLGGTVLMTPLYGPDEKLYALAQGSVSVGGYVFEANSNLVQKNHPTVGRIPHGASVERSVFTDDVAAPKSLMLILSEPDFTTAHRIAAAISEDMDLDGVRVVHAAKVEVPVPYGASVPSMIAKIQNITVVPDPIARVVVNERTGTVVAGGDVRIGEVNISQGDLNVAVSTKFQVSQPSLLVRPGQSIGTVVVPESKLTVSESLRGPVQLENGATVGDLVQALSRIKLTTREIITVLQAIKQAGALHAELVIQ